MSPAIPFTLALLAAALQARQPIWNPDIFWHLKAGEWILTNGDVPRVDPFSFTMAGQPWIAHEWLFEALLAGCYQTWGPTGLSWLVFLLAALYIAGLYLLCRHFTTAKVWAAWITLFAFLPTMPFWVARPHIFAFTLFIWGLYLLLHRKYVFYLGLTLLWANAHASFILAVLLPAGLGLANLPGIRPWVDRVTDFVVLNKIPSPAKVQP